MRRSIQYINRSCITLLLLLVLVMLSSSEVEAGFNSTPTEDRRDDSIVCKDRRNVCAKSAKEGLCRRQPDLMHRLCPESCKVCKSMERTTEFGVKQAITGWDAYELSLIVKETRKYINSELVLGLAPELFLNCWNRHRDCTVWVFQGECETNLEWMQVNCAPACQSCHLLTMEQLELIGVEENQFI